MVTGWNRRSTRCPNQNRRGSVAIRLHAARPARQSREHHGAVDHRSAGSTGHYHAWLAARVRPRELPREFEPFQGSVQHRTEMGAIRSVSRSW